MKPNQCIHNHNHNHDNHIWTIEWTGMMFPSWQSWIFYKLEFRIRCKRSFGQLAMVLFAKGREIHKTTLTNPCSTLTNPCNNRRLWCWQSWNFDKLVFRFRCKPSLGQLATAEESKAGARLRRQTAPFYDYNQSTTKIQPNTVKMQPNAIKKTAQHIKARVKFKLPPVTPCDPFNPLNHP